MLLERPSDPRLDLEPDLPGGQDRSVDAGLNLARLAARDEPELRRLPSVVGRRLPVRSSAPYEDEARPRNVIHGRKVAIPGARGASHRGGFPQPFTTASGSSLATTREMPAAFITATTSATSL
jgi:hypothetical protein